MKESEKSEAQKRWEEAPGYVYFIGAKTPPVAVKIGITTQKTLRDRFMTIQISNHELLTLLGVIPFDKGERPMKKAEEKERELHKRFASLQRFKPGFVGSEWFNAGPELEAFIRENTIRPETRHLPVSIAQQGPAMNKN